jgi:hypothetical protein
MANDSSPITPSDTDVNSASWTITFDGVCNEGSGDYITRVELNGRRSVNVNDTDAEKVACCLGSLLAMLKASGRLSWPSSKENIILAFKSGLYDW